MGKGYYISKHLATAAMVLAAIALVTIIALSAVYNREKSKSTAKFSNATTSPVFPTPKTSNEPWDRYRLPDTLSPQYYNVTLWPRLVKNANEMYIFTGISGVMFTCVKKTDLILIHSNKLNLTLFKGHHAKLTGLSGSVTAPAIKTSWFQTETQYLVIQLEGKLKPGKDYCLYTEFTGELADDLEGFYRTTLHKQIALIVISYFFTLETENVIIAGTAITRTIVGPTKRMSTYLIVFVVSDFTYINAKDKKGVLVRIWARKRAIEDGQGDYAFNITQPILEFFEKYYNTSYPLSIALPDFNSGTMENWGLVTYRETALLYDPRRSANGNKQRIVTVVSHELAHMWFGNLVTVKWWNDLWLNEGFASYPTWNMKDQLILYDLQRAKVQNSTGAAVLKMLSEFLTEPVFAKGLSNYLKQFAFGSSVHLDLWLHLQKVGVKLPYSVHEIMNRWILQMGFPVVTIDTRTGNVSQKHFLLEPEAVVDRKSEFNYELFVPIKWMKKGQVQDQLWLLQKSGTLNHLNKNEWVLANLHVSGYFRVNYDLGNWERLLMPKKIFLNVFSYMIPVVNRAQILDDAFNLARASILNITLALRSTKYLLQEYIPWEAALRNLNYFFQLFDRSEVYGAMQAYLKKQVKPLFEYFGTISSNWTTVPSGHTDQYLEYTMNPEKIRKQDATSTIGYIASNIIGQPLAWDFVRANWDYFFKLYGTGSFTFSRLISDVTNRFCTPFELSQLKCFQKDSAETGFGLGTQALQQAIEKTTAKIKWLEENKEAVLQWFLSESA
uniref:Aminopeptidase n=1 Tax=Sinocyclocheilus anshuiensis TaxID=1608454 RepID=A0A671KUJ9_9TELE